MWAGSRFFVMIDGSKKVGSESEPTLHAGTILSIQSGGKDQTHRILHREEEMKEIEYEKLIQMMIVWGNSINNGDSKLANRSYKSIVTLIQRVNQSEPIEPIIDKLILRPEVPVKYWAYVIALKNNYQEETAEKGLLELYNNRASGAIGLLAKLGIFELNKRKNKQPI